MADEADLPAPEELKQLVSQICGPYSQGIGNWTFAKAPQLRKHPNLRHLLAEGASPDRLDLEVRRLVRDAAGPDTAPATALIGAHPDTTGKRRPARRDTAAKLAGVPLEYFKHHTEAIVIQSVADGLAVSSGLSPDSYRQLQYEYEILSREIEYVIDQDDHYRSEQTVRMRIRSVGSQVRLVNIPYSRRQGRKPPRPTILTRGHTLLGEPQRERAGADDYFFVIYLGRALSFGEEDTIEYSQVFRDPRLLPQPFYWLRIGNPYVGHAQVTVRLPREYMSHGLAFIEHHRDGKMHTAIWREGRSFTPRSFRGPSVEPTHSRVVIRWRLEPRALGRRFEIRWTNEHVHKLEVDAE
jgi:hypothetical protein